MHRRNFILATLFTLNLMPNLASAELVKVPHASGGTIIRDESGFLKGTYTPQNATSAQTLKTIPHGSGSGTIIRNRHDFVKGTFLAGAPVIAKQGGKHFAVKAATGAAAVAAGPFIGTALIIGGGVYTAYELHSYLSNR